MVRFLLSRKEADSAIESDWKSVGGVDIPTTKKPPKLGYGK